MDLLLLNGPPGSGKDAIGLDIQEHLDDSICLKMAQPIRDHICYILGVHNDELDDLKNSGVRFNALGDRTIREEMIYYSENFMKPRYGDDVFGKILLRDVKAQWSGYELITVTDSGFDGEALTLIHSGRFNKVYLARLHRDDTDFIFDSRNYLTLSEDDGLFQVFNIYNNGTIHEASTEIMKVLGYA